MIDDALKLLSSMLSRRARAALKGGAFAVIIYVVQPILWLLTLGVSLNSFTYAAFLREFHTSFLDFEVVGVPFLFSVNIPLFASITSFLEFNNSLVFLAHLLGRRKVVYYYVLADVLFYSFVASLEVLTMVGVAFALTRGALNYLGLIAIPLLLFLGSLTSYCLGVVLNSLTFNVIASPLNFLFSVIQTLLIVFSGVYYPLSGLPIPLRALAFISPYTHLISLARYFLLGYSASNLGALWFNLLPPQLHPFSSIAYVAAFDLALFALATKRLEKARPRAII